ncbi:uroporphyrinogen-III synthase [Ectothiorhodospiraceae bacterium 2226]|nr:uroporphyrinogen-III synthase [Ectothiorhodospiraceae bacterium 2226]
MSATEADGALAGLHVLVTRPAHQAEPLCAALTAEGALPVRFPVLEILDPVDSGPLLAVIDRLDEYDIAVFVSPNAVVKAMNLIMARRTLPPTLQFAAVGRVSAKELRRFIGRDADIFPPRKFDSEALLEQPALQQVAGKRIIIFRGGGGREHLGNVLKERGAQVDYAEAYRRGRPRADVDVLLRAWARGEVDIIAVTSGEGLRNLFDMVGKLGQHWLRKTPLVVVHERMAQLAEELGFKEPPVVAAEASDAAIVEAIRQWHKKRT